MPMRRRLPNRSLPARASALIRLTMLPTVRHAIRSSAVTARLGRPRRQPSSRVVEGAGVARAVARPWHRADNHAVGLAADPPHLGFEVRGDDPQIKRPPPTGPRTAIVLAAPPAADATSAGLRLPQSR